MAKHVLIIDDEELVTKSLLKLLNSNGYQATVAKSGEAALEIIKKAVFDLIVCDVRMPGLDGIETIKQIRAYLEKSDKKPIPEVLITGYADAEKYEMGRNLEVADYLYKPFDNAEFLRVVKKSLAG
jgi:CheY-like chemotaxis protein